MEASFSVQAFAVVTTKSTARENLSQKVE